MKTQQTSTSKQKQQTKPEESTNNDEQQTNNRTTTTLMELIRNKKKRQQENNKTKQQHKQNNKKTKPATGMKKPITENKSQPSADIRLYLAKNFEVEARAAAIDHPDEPTQVRDDSNQPSQIVTSARSEPDTVPGDNNLQTKHSQTAKGRGK